MRLGILAARRLVSSVVVSATIAACSGGEDNGTEPTPTIGIALSANTLTLAQGASGTVNVTLSRGGGFTGPVTLAVEGVPTGVTAAPAPTPIPSGSTASVITINVAATATPGNYNLTVRGSGTGVTDQTTQIALTVNAAPSYTLAATPATVPIQQGGSGTVNVAITRTGGFAGAVALAAEGLPANVTASFNPQSTTTNASVLTLNVGAAVPAGNTTVTIRGTATGQTDKTTTFQLTVNAAPAGGYTMVVAPTSVTVQQGASNTATITLTRTGGFTGAVGLAASGLPNGVTPSFNPQSVTGNTSTLTLTASGTATVGQATVTITGTATGIANQTATLTLNVTGTGGGTGNTVWDFCTTADVPIWLAMQDGTGAWQRVTPTGTRFQFNIASGRGGVAFVSPTTSAMVASYRTLAKRTSTAIETMLLMRNKAAAVQAGRSAARSLARTSSLVDGFATSIYYGTQTELNAIGTSQCLPGAGKTVNGTVANVGVNQDVLISLGDASADASATTPNFTLEGVQDGALDLIASRSTFNQLTFQTIVDKLIIRRGVNAANNSTLPVLDFNATEAFAPAEANLTIGNLGTDTPILTTTFFTSSGTFGAPLFAGFGIGAGPYKYYGVPTARHVTGDLHFAFVLAAAASGDNARLMGVFFKEPTDRTITLGAVLPTQTISVASTTPYVRPRATGSVTADYNTVVQVSYLQETTARAIDIFATAGYLANATSYDFTVPDFSAVSGWNNDWGLKVAAQTEWTVAGTGFTGGLLEPNPVEGAVMRLALRTGTITP